MDNQEQDLKVVLPHHQGDWAILSQLLQNPTEDELQLNNLIKGICGRQAKIFSIIFSKQSQLINQEQFFAKVIPFMKSLVLRLPELFPEPIFHLLTGQDKRHVLTREQVACLLACSFFGFFSESKYEYPSNYDWPKFDITELYTLTTSSHFVLCILHYFERICEEMPTGNILIHRKVLMEQPNYKESKKKIINIEITTELIESFTNHSFHADFANCYIGGGVLGGGTVQEEILFVIKPECLVSMLICTRMEIHEAIIITGTEQFSKYTGYAFNMRYAGDHRDQTPRSLNSNYIKNHIVGIDATVCFGGEREDSLLRDINKAYIGIVNPELEEPGEEHPVFVTGHWGCGAFGGNKENKAVQQIIAASEAGIDLVYSTFSDLTFSKNFQQFISYLQDNNVTVGQLYAAFCVAKRQDFFEKIINHLQSQAKM